MKELLMTKIGGGGGESNIIRADITVGYFNTDQEGESPVYGYSNMDTGSAGKFGQCSNSKILILFSQEATTTTWLYLTTPLVASNVTITRLDTLYSVYAHDADTTKNYVIIDGLLFTQQDLNKTIPIQITF